MRPVMSMKLDGAWRVAYGPVGQADERSFRALPAIPAVVPGAVHSDFIRAGLIPEPLIDRNDEACRWLEEMEFWFVRAFTLTQRELHARMLLTLEGLDTAADIWLNGESLGHCCNAFIAHAFDVTGIVREGENELVVRLDQGLHEVQDKPMWEMGGMWNNTQPRRAWMRKPQYVYGWDWTIWLPTCGIWQSVTLTGHDGVYLSDFHTEITGDPIEGEDVSCWLTVAAEIPDGGQYRAEWEVRDPKGLLVHSNWWKIGGGETTVLTMIPDVCLWQPRGFGDACVYTAAVSLLDADGNVCHRLEKPLGLRTVSLREEKLSATESGFTFIINGNPVFCKGANVVPADCLLGRITAEKERRLVELAAESGMNMLRVWGGGVYASEAFLDACDRLGIMVWHDFMYACGYYPDHDPVFYANITREAEAAIRRLRCHPCVIGWSGNNECQEMYLGQQRWKKFPFYGERIYTELLPRLVKELHPGAIYRESSPLGDADDPAGSLTGDQHIWHFTHRPNDEHYLDLWRFTDFPVKFLSEFGVIGAMTRETTEACLSPEHRDPEDPVWLFHTNDGQDHTLLNKFMDVYFGDVNVPGSGFRGLELQQYILRSQCIQAEILRHIYDEFRARKFVCSGLLFWTLGDSMGIHNWSLIDYQLRRKPAYHAMKRAMADVIPVIRGYEVQTFRGREDYRTHWAGTGEKEPLEIWAVNDTLQERPVSIAWRVMTLCGQVLRGGTAEAVVPANASVPATAADVSGLVLVPEETILHVTLTTADGRVSENRYFFAPYREVLQAVQRLGVRPQYEMERVDQETVRLRLSGEGFVWQLHIAEPEGVLAADNDFDLLPGEARVVTVKAPAGYEPELHWIGEV